MPRPDEQINIPERCSNVRLGKPLATSDWFKMAFLINNAQLLSFLALVHLVQINGCLFIAFYYTMKRVYWKYGEDTSRTMLDPILRLQLVFDGRIVQNWMLVGAVCELGDFDLCLIYYKLRPISLQSPLSDLKRKLMFCEILHMCSHDFAYVPPVTVPFSRYSKPLAL